MDENLLTAPGPGPFYISAAQRATVRVLETSVEVTIYATLPGKGSDPQPISFQLVRRPAYDLGVALLNAADQLEQKSS